MRYLQAFEIIIFSQFSLSRVIVLLDWGRIAIFCILLFMFILLGVEVGKMRLTTICSAFAHSRLWSILLNSHPKLWFTLKKVLKLLSSRYIHVFPYLTELI